jgi:3-oxoacyl-[acyl-carrier protein] reductase
MNIFVTGGNTGIGAELVKQLLESEQVYKVYTISRSTQHLEILKKKYHNKLYFSEFDLNQTEKITELRNKILSEIETVHVLINNAGMLVNKAFETISQDEIKSISNVNFIAPFLLIQSFMPQLISNKGQVLNITTMGGVNGTAKFAGLSSYSSSKGAIGILTECLAQEYSNSNVTINALALGAVDTQMLQNAFPNYKADMSAQKMASFIYNFIFFQSQYYNGKVLPVSFSTP